LPNIPGLEGEFYSEWQISNCFAELAVCMELSVDWNECQDHLTFLQLSSCRLRQNIELGLNVDLGLNVELGLNVDLGLNVWSIHLLEEGPYSVPWSVDRYLRGMFVIQRRTEFAMWFVELMCLPWKY
jgi:hypothetical protein